MSCDIRFYLENMAGTTSLDVSDRITVSPTPSSSLGEISRQLEDDGALNQNVLNISSTLQLPTAINKVPTEYIRVTYSSHGIFWGLIDRNSESYNRRTKIYSYDIVDPMTMLRDKYAFGVELKSSDMLCPYEAGFNLGSNITVNSDYAEWRLPNGRYNLKIIIKKSYIDWDLSTENEINKYEISFQLNSGPVTTIKTSDNFSSVDAYPRVSHYSDEWLHLSMAVYNKESPIITPYPQGEFNFYLSVDTDSNGIKHLYRDSYSYGVKNNISTSEEGIVKQLTKDLYSELNIDIPEAKDHQLDSMFPTGESYRFPMKSLGVIKDTTNNRIRTLAIDAHNNLMHAEYDMEGKLKGENSMSWDTGTNYKHRIIRDYVDKKIIAISGIGNDFFNEQVTQEIATVDSVGNYVLINPIAIKDWSEFYSWAARFYNEKKFPLKNPLLISIGAYVYIIYPYPLGLFISKPFEDISYMLGTDGTVVGDLFNISMYSWDKISNPKYFGTFAIRDDVFVNNAHFYSSVTGTWLQKQPYIQHVSNNNHQKFCFEGEKIGNYLLITGYGQASKKSYSGAMDYHTYHDKNFIGLCNLDRLAIAKIGEINTDEITTEINNSYESIIVKENLPTGWFADGEKIFEWLPTGCCIKNIKQYPTRDGSIRRFPVSYWDTEELSFRNAKIATNCRNQNSIRFYKADLENDIIIAVKSNVVASYLISEMDLLENYGWNYLVGIKLMKYTSNNWEILKQLRAFYKYGYLYTDMHARTLNLSTTIENIDWGAIDTLDRDCIISKEQPYTGVKYTFCGKDFIIGSSVRPITMDFPFNDIWVYFWKAREAAQALYDRVCLVKQKITLSLPLKDFYRLKLGDIINVESQDWRVYETSINLESETIQVTGKESA